MAASGIVARHALLVLLGAYLPAAHSACGPEQYFAPQDATNAKPLKSPHAEFQATRARALRGDAMEQRNLAAFYESGYLVTACREKAAYWYARAARQGDAAASAWLGRQAAMENLRSGNECFGNACFAAAKDGVQKTVLQLGSGNAYSASVTINGRTVPGIIDTGATSVAMSARTANELGIAYQNGKQVQIRTANGIARGRLVILDSMSVGNITLTQVEAVVGDADHPLLVGMSFLNRLTISTDGKGMTLVKP